MKFVAHLCIGPVFPQQDAHYRILLLGLSIYRSLTDAGVLKVLLTP